MPSGLHEVIIELFRNRPALAAEVLERFLRLDLPGFKEARLAGGDLPKLKPAERRADAVVMLHRERAEPDLASLYADVLLAELPTALRKTAEEELRAKIEYRSDFARSYYAQGEAKGREEGRAEGEAIAVLAVLAARGVAVTPDQEARVKGCTDLDQLGEWLRRALTADSADQLFA